MTYFFTFLERTNVKNLDLVDFVATSTIDDNNTMKKNVLGLVDRFVKFLVVSSHVNFPLIYDVLEVGVFARTVLA